MDVLWVQGPSTVQQVLNLSHKKSLLAYNSVLTTLSDNVGMEMF
jgi:predicted transcriptional regulator